MLAVLAAERDRRMEERDRRMDERDRRVDTELEAIRKGTATALASAQKAVDKAEAAQDLRNAAQNEWRQTIGDRDRLLMPRSESAAQFQSITEKIDALSSRMDRWEGKTTVMDPQLTTMMSEVKSLLKSKDVGEGVSTGKAALWALIVGGLVAAGAIAGLIARMG